MYIILFFNFPHCALRTDALPEFPLFLSTFIVHMVELLYKKARNKKALAVTAFATDTFVWQILSVYISSHFFRT